MGHSSSDTRVRIRLGMRGRLLLVTLPLVAVAFAVVLVLANRAAQQGLHALLTENLTLSAENLAGAVAAPLGEARADAILVSQIDLSAEAIETGDPKIFSWYADETISTTRKYAAVILWTPEGKVVAANTVGRLGGELKRPLIGSQLDDDPWVARSLAAGLSTPQWIAPSRPAFARRILADSEQVAGFGLAVRDILDEPVGAVAVLLSLEVLSEILEGSVTRRGDRFDMAALIVDSAGQPIVVPHNLPYRDAWRKARVPAPSTDGTLTPWTTPGGDRVLLAQSEIKTEVAGLGWRVVTAKDKQSLEAPVTTLQRRVSLAAVLAVLTTLIVLVIVATNFLNPLRRLTHAASATAQARDYEPLTIRASDEVGVLTGSFNHMMAGLKKSEIHLEDMNVRLKESLDTQVEVTNAYSRFVPREFLGFLEKETITDVQLGDHVAKEMTVLFSDIRDFTTLSEQLSPEANFRFINDYLGRMEPIIERHNGFIDKYIGDAIMALFSSSADDAVRCSIAMIRALGPLNEERVGAGEPPIRIGIGLNTGTLMLGTVGGERRMDGTVISDAVNLSSRIEGLSKRYRASLLIAEHTFNTLEDPSEYAIREIDRVRVKGKSEPVRVYEVLDGDADEQAKRQTLEDFQRAVAAYRGQSFVDAHALFEQILSVHPGDQAAAIYLERCSYFAKHGVGDDWDLGESLASK